MAFNINDAFTQQELDIFQMTFTLFDKDQNGELSLAEAKTALDKFGAKMSQTDFEFLLSQLGISETVDFLAFQVMLMKKREIPIETKQENSEFFLMQREEIKELFQEMGENISDEEFDRMFRDAEFNDEGEITLPEYIRILYSN